MLAFLAGVHHIRMPLVEESFDLLSLDRSIFVDAEVLTAPVSVVVAQSSFGAVVVDSV